MPPFRRSEPRPPLSIGFLALTDAAPLFVAQELGLFARHRLAVNLRREVGWATLRDKLLFGELAAAHALAPMLWASALGLSGPSGDVLTAFVLNLNGNALTLARALRDAGAHDPASLRRLAHERRGERKLTFGVVYRFSAHHLLLRNWLRTAGLDAERDVRIVVVPPAQMVRNLATGNLDGFCAGEPWNSLAIARGVGWCPTWSASFAPGHLEKVLMVRREFAERQPDTHAALVAALDEAALWCDEPQNRARLATLLAKPNYLDLPLEILQPALEGRFDTGLGHEEVPDFIVFHRGGANAPTLARAKALQQELVAGGLLPADLASADLPARLFREDLYHAALESRSLRHEQVL
ncbi:MAG TPA: CmpA/NrtA family ABC transporter substrate-binding protein [Opitutaceae bacterium]|nr:CmpA/NrtA family ABC transporter substrate-binding protein [Opitutaceae bacterium]